MDSLKRSSRVAFLLCGGAGTRLRGTTDRPKAVLEVAGWPLLAYHLAALRGSGIERLVFLTGYRGEEIERSFGPPSEERVFVREAEPLGTGGALSAARGWAGEINLVLNGDSFADALPIRLLEAGRPEAATILAVRVGDVSAYGSLRLGERDRIEGFHEKGSSGEGWINAGIYCLPRSMIRELPRGASSIERDAFPRWAREGRLWAHRAEVFFRDIGTPERLVAAQSEFIPIRERLESRRD